MFFVSNNNTIFENKNYKTLNVLTFGYEKCKPCHSFAYALTDFYLLHCVISGMGTFVVDKKEFKIGKGKMFIIKPNHSYSYIADNDNPWEYIWISFNGELADLFEKLPDVIDVSTDFFTEMLEVNKLKNTQTEFLLSKLYALVSHLFECSPKENDYIKTVSDFVKNNYMHKINISELSSAMNLNSRYLSRIFKKEKGITLQEYIIKYKVKKAKTLLENGFSVNEVAKIVGYDDYYTFSKMFKKNTNQTPRDYASSAKKSVYDI